MFSCQKFWCTYLPIEQIPKLLTKGKKCLFTRTNLYLDQVLSCIVHTDNSDNICASCTISCITFIHYILYISCISRTLRWSIWVKYHISHKYMLAQIFLYQWNSIKINLYWKNLWLQVGSNGFKDIHLIFFPAAELFLLFQALIGADSVQYANGVDGRTRRKLYDPAFGHDAIRYYMGTFNEVNAHNYVICYKHKFYIYLTGVCYKHMLSTYRLLSVLW